jgi:hypothetical protein
VIQGLSDDGGYESGRRFASYTQFLAMFWQSRRDFTLSDAGDENGYDVDWSEMVRPHMRRTLSQNNIPMPAANSAAHGRLLSAFVEKPSAHPI